MLGVIIGLIIGGIVTVASLAGGLFFGGSEGAGGGLMFGLGAIIIMPITYGIGGLIGGLVTGFLYNIAAKWVGGIELECNSNETRSSASEPRPQQPIV